MPRRLPDASDRDWFEILVLGLLAAVSLWVIALNLYYAAVHHLVWTRIDGQFPVDQMQYLAWIQDASRHVLVSDLFSLHRSPHDFLQPLVAISGGLAALGVAPWLALLLWKPVALVAIFFAVRAYCRASLAGRWQRRVALAVALFAGWNGLGGNVWLPFESWGYPYDLLAVAALIAAVLAYCRARSHDRISRSAPALALAASWLHPWQGELFVVIVVGIELVELRRRRALDLRRQIVPAAVPVAAALLPLVYFAILDRTDQAWRLAHVASEFHWGLWGLVLPVAPLLLAALPAYATRPRDTLALATRVWPVAALAIWAVNETSLGGWSFYAWIAVTVPLGVLAVEGISSIQRWRIPGYRTLATLAVLLVTVPATVHMMLAARQQVHPGRHRENLITASESRALQYLARSRQAGGVLSWYFLGDTVPGETDRSTYVGDPRWSPNYLHNQDRAWQLLAGWLGRYRARAFVLQSGARFLLADCHSHANFAWALGPVLQATHRFGCAAVYRVA